MRNVQVRHSGLGRWVVDDRASGRPTAPALFAVLVLALLSACFGCDDTAHQSSTGVSGSGGQSGRRQNPVVDARGAVHNITFYYQGNLDLRPGADLSGLGHPALVVTTPKSNEPAAVEAIHSRGARAYRYLQFFWAPDDEGYEGINLARHPGWALCGPNGHRLVGRYTGSGDNRHTWYFIDANEKNVRDALLEQLRKLKNEGWDGVMFDRGGAALTNAAAADGTPVWDRTSTCTDDPYERGARFADAYVNMLGLAHRAGLKVLLNYGISAFDPHIPMRPDPAQQGCRQRTWEKCRFTRDGWANVDLVLNESIAFPRDQEWQRTFEANRRSERDKTHGRRVVGLISTYTLGGRRHQNRHDVFYEWARVKLFDLALAVNTGDAGCPDSRSGVCNRYGTYPDLVDVRFGRPASAAPHASACAAHSNIHCIWTRTYQGGIDVVNVSGEPRQSVPIRLPGSDCRYVYDVFSRRMLSKGRCVRTVTLDVPPWSGRPLVTSTTPPNAAG